MVSEARKDDKESILPWESKNELMGLPLLEGPSGSRASYDYTTGDASVPITRYVIGQIDR